MNDSHDSLIGTRIRQYEIRSFVGSGGMGAVYKATDTELDRTVALKVLAPTLLQHAAAAAEERFRYEARCAAIEHPNLCTVYEIGRSETGQTFIAMAYYEGETLHDRIARGRLPPRQALTYAIGIARGLDCTHRAGIIHRDIKPHNIFITEHDEIKILDFGLAKAAADSQPSAPGHIPGTPDYMSPEQMDGDTIDQRTDLWSLGICLYEMLCGAHPFQADYAAATRHAIQHHDVPSLPERCPDVPAEAEQILDRALKKKPAERFSSAAAMLMDLQSAHDKLAAPIDNHHLRGTKLWGAVAIIAGMAVLIGYLLFQLPNQEISIKLVEHRPLTRAQGLEHQPSWSKDGTQIAFASDEKGNMDIWVRQLTASQGIPLTEDHDGFDGNPAWSPDGEWIAFVSDRQGGGIYRIPHVGGTAERLIRLEFVPLTHITSVPDLSWSPDGTKLAYGGTVAYPRLSILDLESLTSTKVTWLPNRTPIAVSEPAWSPRGNRLACTEFSGTGTSVSTIWTIRTDGSDPQPVTELEPTSFNHRPVWSADGKHLFFISNREGGRDIWSVRIDRQGRPVGPPKQLTAGDVGVGAIALSRDGHHLAYSKLEEKSNIWSVAIEPKPVSTLEDADPITDENHRIEFLDLAPDGDRIAFDSDRNGTMQIWIMRRDGSDLRALTRGEGHDFRPRFSPDGQQIAFYSLRSGNRDIYVKPIDGGAARQLTDHPETDWMPSWSPDGREIAFGSMRAGSADIWVVPASGGAPRQLTFTETRDDYPVWSPDGTRLVYGSRQEGTNDLYLVPAEGGEPTRLTHQRWWHIYPFEWSADGETIYAYGRHAAGHESRGAANLWAVNAGDGTVRPLTEFRLDRKEPYMSLAADAERLYFPLWERRGDLFIAEVQVDDP